MTEGMFFQDLAVIMTLAGIAAVIFSRFGWPKALGYIAAGVLMSPNTFGGSFLTSPASTQILGQLGVVFLMFGMGLTFSASELKRIRGVVLPIAILDTLVMIWLGYTLGTRVFGWTSSQSLFLGVAICDSATTLLAKVLEEMGWKDRPFARFVVGSSVCEDIICVGAIAVATGFARGNGMNAVAFTSSIGYLMIFFLAVVVLGFVLVPRLLTSIDKRKDDEALIITVLGCLFGVSYVALKYDFSLALGAFLVGIIGSTSDVHHKLENLAAPLKSMFSAIFFASIGLLVNPTEIWHYLPVILLVSAVVVFGKFFNSTFASLVSGTEVKTAVQNGCSLAQIGEFAFMVAILYAGITDNADNPMFQIAVGASLVTTLLNPVLIKFSDPFGDWVQGTLPERFAGYLAAYRDWLEKFRSGSDTPAYFLLKNNAIKLGVYAGLMFAVNAVCTQLYKFDYSRFSEFFERHDVHFFFVLQNLFTLMLAPLILSAARAFADELSAILTGDGNLRWQQHLRPLIHFFAVGVIIALFFTEWTMINIAMAPSDNYSFLITCVVMAIVGIVGWRFFAKAGHRASIRFNEALSAEERRSGIATMLTITLPEGMIQRFVLEASSPAIGLTVAALNIRAKTGASITSVTRAGVTVRNIGPDWEFAVGDRVTALGEPPQIVALKDLLGVING